MALTIHNLEVRFDVEADDDEVFSRLFAEHIRRWSRRHEAEHQRLREVDREQALGDTGSEEPW
jgi:hypothetical protein